MAADARFYPTDHRMSVFQPKFELDEYTRLDVTDGKRGVAVYAAGRLIGLLVTAEPS